MVRYNIDNERQISIHALVKRATVKRIDKKANQAISIHALVKRATLTDIIQEITWGISIHALVKRATENLYNDYLYFGTKYHISDIFPQ